MSVRDLSAPQDLPAHPDTFRQFDERAKLKLPVRGVAMLRVKTMVR